MKWLCCFVVLCLTCLGYSQQGEIQLTTAFGMVTLSTYGFASGSSTEQIVTGFLGGNVNQASGSFIEGYWAKTGTVDPITGSVNPVPMSNQGGYLGWPPMNAPYNAQTPIQLNNDYQINAGSSYGVQSYNQVGVDADLFTLIGEDYSGLNQVGQYSFCIVEYLSASSSTQMLAHEDITITSAMINGYSNGNGSGSTGSTSGGSTSGSSGSTGSSIDLTQTNNDLTTLNSTVQNQPANTSNFWSGLFVPQQTTVTNMQNSVAQYQNWGPLTMFAGWYQGINGWQAGGEASALGYVIHFGQVQPPAMGVINVDLDLRNYSTAIATLRALMAGALWFAAFLLWGKRISHFI